MIEMNEDHNFSHYKSHNLIEMNILENVFLGDNFLKNIVAVRAHDLNLK